ncbi:MAG TPA: Calx-beta domain-containing protein [Elainellaceae cyanobacterium]
MPNIVVQAEDISTLVGYIVENDADADNGALLSLFNGSAPTSPSEGTASFTFNNSAGFYDIRLGYFDESDGQSSVEISVDALSAGIVNFNRDLGSGGVDPATKTRTFDPTEPGIPVDAQLDIENVRIASDSLISLNGSLNGTEFARVDFVEFIPVATGTLAFSAPSLTAAEDASTVQVTVTRTGSSDGIVSAGVSVVGGTASAADFTLGTTVVTFADGETEKLVTVDLIDDDLVENAETISLGLSSIDESFIGAQSTTLLTITDNDTTTSPPSPPTPPDDGGSGNGSGGGSDDDGPIIIDDGPIIIIDGDVILGTSGNDIFVGTERNDRIRGFRGNDVLFGGDGDDIIIGNALSDRLRGGNGDDTLRGGMGSDLLIGWDGDDILIGNGLSDTLKGGSGDDTIRGGLGADVLRGGADNDKLYGGNSSDTLRGGSGDDLHVCGAGNDTARGGRGDDKARGGGGSDTLIGGDGNDILFGGGGEDLLIGGSGNDLLNGRRGEDLLVGGSGEDTFVIAANQGLDTIRDFESGDDKLKILGSVEFSSLSITQAGNGALVSFENKDIALLVGIEATVISASDFV